MFLPGDFEIKLTNFLNRLNFLKRCNCGTKR